MDETVNPLLLVQQAEQHCCMRRSSALLSFCVNFYYLVEVYALATQSCWMSSAQFFNVYIYAGSRTACG